MIHKESAFETCINRGAEARFTCPVCHAEYPYADANGTVFVCDGCQSVISCFVVYEPISVCKVLDAKYEHMKE